MHGETHRGSQEGVGVARMPVVGRGTCEVRVHLGRPVLAMMMHDMHPWGAAWQTQLARVYHVRYQMVAVASNPMVVAEPVCVEEDENRRIMAHRIRDADAP